MTPAMPAGRPHAHTHFLCALGGGIRPQRGQVPTIPIRLSWATPPASAMDVLRAATVTAATLFAGVGAGEISTARTAS